jgi:AAA15 family ATPase/GTPase
MLVEFRFKNFLSYWDEASLNMTRIKSFKEHISTHTFPTGKGFDLLKTVAIYGSNGGGKSNFIGAMGSMKKRIHNSFADSLKKEEDKDPDQYYFELNNEGEVNPSFFEVSFIEENILYRYGFKVKRHDIVEEWLYKKNEVETMLFERTGQSFEVNSKGFPEGKKYRESVNSNVLFISHLAQNNTKIASIIFNWFSNLNVVSGLEDAHYHNVTKELLKDSSSFKIWLTHAIKFLEITDIELTKDKELLTYHNKYDANNIIVGSVPFNIHRESQGTRKLIYLLGAIYDTLMLGRILFIDEIDSKLHPNLTKRLLQFFHQINLNKAQFIFTAHDAVLLDKEIFRRDQIWFVDRNKFGSSELYAMSDFDASVVRNTSDYRKKYLEKTFGAAESIDITNDLIKLMHEQEA